MSTEAQAGTDQPQAAEAPPMESPSIEGPIGPSKATEAFAEVLGPSGVPPTKEPTPEPEATPEPVEADSELQLRESLDQPDSESSGSDPLDQLIDIAGEKRSAKEWKDGFMKNTDYTQKTQEMANDRKQMESVTQQTNQMREQYAASLGLITKAAQDDVKQFEGVDWAYMAETNPQDFMKFRAAYDMSKERLSNVESEAQSFFSAVDVETKKSVQSKAINCVQDLKQHFKNWNNDTYYGLVEYGVNQGIEKNAMLNCTDPGVFKALYKARLFDKGKSVKTERTAADSPTRVGHGRNEKGQFVSGGNKALENLQKTGKKEYAVAAFSELIGG